MRRESRERVAPTIITTGDEASTSTGNHASHLHTQYPTPSLRFSNPLSLSRADSPGHRRRGQLPPPPATATTIGLWASDVTPTTKEKLPPTDSRLRPDQRCLENGEYDMANLEKLYLEQQQRQMFHLWSSSGIKIWRDQWREPSVKSRGWEKKSSDHTTVKDSSAAAKVSYGTNNFAKTSENSKWQ